MSDNLNPNLDRRAFLKGATTVIGAGALASTGLTALAPAEAVISVAFLDGDNLIPLQWLTSAHAPFERVQITVEAHGKGAITGVTANFGKYPFHAWTAGGGSGRFEMPVDCVKGLSFTVFQGDSKVALLMGNSSGVKLREGKYIIAAGRVNWKLFRAESGVLLGAGGKPTSLQHVLISVERA